MHAWSLLSAKPIQVISFIYYCAISNPPSSDTRNCIIYHADFASFIIDACKASHD